MPSLEEQVWIGAPREMVFSRLTDARRAPEWTPNLVRVDPVPGTPEGPGGETTVLASAGGRTSRGRGRCLDWEPPRRLVLETSLDIGVTSTSTFLLEEQDNGTLLSARVNYSLPQKGLGRLVGGLIGDTVARRDLRRALATLKHQLELEARS